MWKRVRMFIYEYSVVDPKIQSYIVESEKLHKYFSFDWGTLKTRQYCGILNIEGENIYLLPKISNKEEKTNLDIFIYMLIYAYDMQLENEDIASCRNENQTILEVFVQLFAKQLFRELQMGVYKEYITEEDNLTTLRGKYLVNENIRHNFTNSKIYCEYDEFSMNNELNQFFLYAIKTLQHFVKDIRVLKQCELVLDEVEYRSFDIESFSTHFHRLNYRFQESFEFALLLLKQSIPLFSKENKSFAFLFDMNILFEKFVGKMFQEIDPSTELQNEKVCSDLVLRPDILTDRMIVDTKYKKLGAKNEIKQSDKLQMYAYGKNFGQKDTMLLYPRHLEHFNFALKLDEVNLFVKSLELNVECFGYEEYIEIMRSKIRELLR